MEKGEARTVWTGSKRHAAVPPIVTRKEGNRSEESEKKAGSDEKKRAGAHQKKTWPFHLKKKKRMGAHEGGGERTIKEHLRCRGRINLLRRRRRSGNVRGYELDPAREKENGGGKFASSAMERRTHIQPTRGERERENSTVQARKKRDSNCHTKEKRSITTQENIIGGKETGKRRDARGEDPKELGREEKRGIKPRLEEEKKDRSDYGPGLSEAKKKKERVSPKKKKKKKKKTPPPEGTSLRKVFSKVD